MFTIPYSKFVFYPKQDIAQEVLSQKFVQMFQVTMIPFI